MTGRATSAADQMHAIRPCGQCMARPHGVCKAVTTADLPRLAEIAAIVQVARGQTFIHQDASAEHLYIVILGSAKLYKRLRDGRRQIVGFGYANALLGLAASDVYGFSAEAIEPIRMCRIPRQGLQPLMQQCPEMEQQLLSIATDDLMVAQEQMLLLGRKTAVERVASFLALQMRGRRPADARWLRIHLPMSRNDIADYLGMTIETVSRSLAKLRDQGVIAVPNTREVAVLDHARLLAFAQGALIQTPTAAINATMN